MPVTVEAIWLAPVKSLALQRVERAQLTVHGIRGDRAFFLVDERGRIATQREHPALTQVYALYDPDRGELAIRLPGGETASAVVQDAGALTAVFSGRQVRGVLVRGPWEAALSRFIGAPLLFVRATGGDAFDDSPLSLCSRASLDPVRDGVPAGVTFDERRFRQNLLLAGCAPFEEESWIGRRVTIGAAAAAVPRKLDTRCVITTHDPDSGEADFDTLGHIASRHGDRPEQVTFGVYASVVTPGDVRVCDTVLALEEATA
jgi:uncharacterized protein YcbX